MKLEKKKRKNLWKYKVTCGIRGRLKNQELAGSGGVKVSDWTRI
jgi:hypothetical protein